MRILVKVKPSAKEGKIEKMKDGRFKVFVKEPPKNSLANEELRKLLAQYFDAPSQRIRIIKGLTVPNKIVEIYE